MDCSRTEVWTSSRSSDPSTTQECINLKQGNRSVTHYYNELTSVWHAYLSAFPYPKTSAEAAKVLAERNESNMLLQFLMGLNDEFSQVCNQILLLDHMPSCDRVFSMICDVESHKEMMSSNNMSSDLILSTTDSRNVKEVVNFTNVAPDRVSNVVGNRLNNWKITKRSVVCDFCKKTGHTKDTCFDLHGTPDWYKKRAD